MSQKHETRKRYIGYPNTGQSGESVTGHWMFGVPLMAWILVWIYDISVLFLNISDVFGGYKLLNTGQKEARVRKFFRIRIPTVFKI